MNIFKKKRKLDELTEDIETNTSNIAINQTNITTNTADITTNTTDIRSIHNCVVFSGTANWGASSPDQWLIPFNNELVTAHANWSGRFYMPESVTLSHLIGTFDTEGYNSFLTGYFTVDVFAEPRTSSGFTPYNASSTRIYGRNESSQPVRVESINSGLTPSGYTGQANGSAKATPNVTIPGDSFVTMRVIDFNQASGLAGAEIKFYLYYTIPLPGGSNSGGGGSILGSGGSGNTASSSSS